MRGVTYIQLDRRGREVRAIGMRASMPDRGGKGTGVWVKVVLDVPESVFQAYEATLTLPELDTEGTIAIKGEETIIIEEATTITIEEEE